MEVKDGSSHSEATVGANVAKEMYGVDLRMRLCGLGQQSGGIFGGRLMLIFGCGVGGGGVNVEYGLWMCVRERITFSNDPTPHL